MSKNIMNENITLRKYFDAHWLKIIGDSQTAPRHMIMRFFDMADATPLNELLMSNKLPSHTIKNVKDTQIDKDELFELIESDDQAFYQLITT